MLTENQRDNLQKTTPCPECGHDSPAGLRFCDTCGSPLAAEGGAPSPPSHGLMARGWRRIRTSLGTWDAAPPWWLLATYGTLLPVAAGMRLWDLGARAMHHDESLHAYYAWNLYSGKGLEHNPMMHGPFQMEATAGAYFLFGDSDFTARLIYALAGTALVVLPYFLRARLGNLGALLVSIMLAFSPAMFYFSRFARNDIFMAVWTLGLVICMWRYIDEGKNRYLYIAAAVLALAFATKETAYMATVILGLYLAGVVISQNWPAIRQGITIGHVSPPVAVARLTAGAFSVAARGLSLSGISRPASFLVLMFTLTLPLGAALISVFQDTPLLGWSNLVLTSPEGGEGPIGAPLRGGMVVAFVTVVALVWLATVVGLRWNRSLWWRSALIFWAVWLLLYTTFFTHIAGVGSGIWQSLGYWLVQQGEGRGGQPLYYYFVIAPIYEFLPLLFAVIGTVYYMRRKDPFGRFLVFWALATLALYTIASEKMPWLLVNIAMPLIVLAGRFLSDVVRAIRWRELVAGGGLLILAGVPAFLVLAWRLAFASVDPSKLTDLLAIGASMGLMAALVALGAYVARRVGYRDFASFAAVPLAAILLVLSVRAGWYAGYRNGDIPVEMIVYTQTSPDIPGLLKQVERAGDAEGGRTGVPIGIDSTSGFTWPWAWYLRDYKRVVFGTYKGEGLEAVPNSSVQLVHSNNRTEAGPALGDRYTEGARIRHRWWFPENYKDLTLRKFLGAMVDRESWRRAMDYFLYRKLGPCLGSEGPYACLGSEDAYVYFSRDFPADFTPMP